MKTIGCIYKGNCFKKSENVYGSVPAAFANLINNQSIRDGKIAIQGRIAESVYGGNRKTGKS
jgi:hypothetical protein